MKVRVVGLTILVVTLVLLIIFKGGTILPETSVSEEPTTETVRETESESIDPDRFPVVEGGLGSWKEVLEESEKDSEFLRYLSEMTGLSLDEIRLLAKLEAEGYDYSISLPKGTEIVNSGRKEGVFFENEGPLREDRAALTELKGVPVILVSCGNPIKLTPQPKPKPKQPTEPVVIDKPSVRTDNSPWVSQTSADLAGFVDPKGTANVWFQWGRTTDFEGTPTNQSTISSSQSITTRIGNLQPETKYYFRIVAKNEGGTSYGETRTFMTDF